MSNWILEKCAWTTLIKGCSYQASSDNLGHQFCSGLKIWSTFLEKFRDNLRLSNCQTPFMFKFTFISFFIMSNWILEKCAGIL